jgi:hypothetical protein
MLRQCKRRITMTENYHYGGHSINYVIMYNFLCIESGEFMEQRWTDAFCDWYHIQCVCDHSENVVVISSCNTLKPRK